MRIEYKIIKAKSIEVLEKKVTESIGEEFQPLGGVVIDREGNFYQAMTKRKV